jgi:HAD superfamily phosphatase (TIGR01668 family)
LLLQRQKSLPLREVFRVKAILISEEGIFMFSLLFPYEYVDSVFSIDYKKLLQKGYKGIIFDIDMTLVPHGADSTAEIDALFKSIQAAGLKTLLLTNNSEERVKRFIRNIDTLYLCDAQKPNPECYLKAVEMMGIRKNETLFIGDQIFIDIYGANKCGIANILVKYVTAEVETKIGIRRNLEKIILALYRITGVYQHRLGDILKTEQ